MWTLFIITHGELVSSNRAARACVWSAAQDGWTALMRAAYYNTADTVAELVRLGADINGNHSVRVRCCSHPLVATADAASRAACAGAVDQSLHAAGLTADMLTDGACRAGATKRPRHCQAVRPNGHRRAADEGRGTRTYAPDACAHARRAVAGKLQLAVWSHTPAFARLQFT
jgi:hypothetical protein